MHHAIVPRKVGLEHDHINGGRLDNRRCNLRVVTKSQNQANQRPRGPGKYSRFKGVGRTWQRPSGMTWFACVQKDKRRYGKRCATELEAAVAHDMMAIKLHGEYARVNFACSRLLLMGGDVHVPGVSGLL